MDNNFFYLFNSIIWPALAIFELVVVIIAYNKYRHSSTGLMLAGGVIGIITSLSYPLISLIGYYGSMTEYIYPFLNLLGLVGNLLFLVGLLNLIHYLFSLKSGETTVADNF